MNFLVKTGLSVLACLKKIAPGSRIFVHKRKNPPVFAFLKLVIQPLGMAKFEYERKHKENSGSWSPMTPP